MVTWNRTTPLPVGGLVAVAFWDEDTVAVGSHSGLRLVDARSGIVRDRADDPSGDYAWLQADPPAIRKPGPAGITLVAAMGPWGGELPTRTDDGWSASVGPTGATVRHIGGETFGIADSEEPRALGFSAGGTLLVFATAATLHLCHR